MGLRRRHHQHRAQPHAHLCRGWQLHGQAHRPRRHQDRRGRTDHRDKPRQHVDSQWRLHAGRHGGGCAQLHLAPRGVQPAVTVYSRRRHQHPRGWRQGPHARRDRCRHAGSRQDACRQAGCRQGQDDLLQRSPAQDYHQLQRGFQPGPSATAHGAAAPSGGCQCRHGYQRCRHPGLGDRPIQQSDHLFGHSDPARDIHLYQHQRQGKGKVDCQRGRGLPGRGLSGHRHRQSARHDAHQQGHRQRPRDLPRRGDPRRHAHIYIYI